MANLGTLTLDVVAKIGGFTSGLTEAERASKKSSDAITKNIESIGIAGYALGTALGGFIKDGVTALANAFPALIDQAAQFQDIADKTGGSAEGFANFAVSAKVAGVEVDAIADATVKLSKNLVDIDSKTSTAAAGLKALGVNAKEFAQLKPDEQIEKLASAFDQFADGGEKAAVAQQLFGRSGAELLKFFKDYVDNGGAVNVLTADMIQKADDFADAQARLRAEISLFASALATNFLEPLTEVIKLVKQAIGEIYNLDVAATKVGTNNAIKEFAEDCGRALAGAIDYVKTSATEFLALKDLVTTAAEQLVKVAKFDFAGAIQAGADFKKKYGLNDLYQKVGEAGAEAGKSYAQQFDAALARNNADRNRRLLNQSNYGSTGDIRPKLNPISTVGKGGGNSAAQEAKARLDADLSAIKNAQKELTDSYANQEKLLEAMRSAGLTDEKDYYAQKKDLLQKNVEANVQAQQEIIARLQAEKVSGKDAIDNAKKIADAQSQLTKIQADGATQAKVLGIQEESAYRKTASALLAARQAAQDYFDTVNEGYASTLAGIGKGSKARDFDAALQQINEKYQQQRQTLANQRSQAELLSGGTLSPDAAKRFDDQLAIINEFQSKSVTSYENYYKKLDESQKNWVNGATEALNNYADEASNVAKHTEEAFTNAFKGLEDQFTNLLTGKKFDVNELVSGIATDAARNVTKEFITGPLAKLGSSLLGVDLGDASGSKIGTQANPMYVKSVDGLGGVTGGFTGAQGSGGLLSSLFGGASKLFGGFGNSTATSLANVSGGGLDDLLKFTNNFSGFASGGFTGHGSANEPAGIVHKGEYVLTAAQTKAIGVGNLDRGNMGGGTSINVNVTGQVDARTRLQIANDLSLQQRQAKRYA